MSALERHAKIGHTCHTFPSLFRVLLIFQSTPSGIDAAVGQNK